jgi:hypothetical protein
MSKIKKHKDFPPKSIINKSFGKTDYLDTYCMSISNPKNYSKDAFNFYSSTIVHYNNLLGRVYFFFVKPFHKLIIHAMLKMIKTRINKIN